MLRHKIVISSGFITCQFTNCIWNITDFDVDMFMIHTVLYVWQDSRLITYSLNHICKIFSVPDAFLIWFELFTISELQFFTFFQDNFTSTELSLCAKASARSISVFFYTNRLATYTPFINEQGPIDTYCNYSTECMPIEIHYMALINIRSNLELE